jgi:hypothetical protein
MFEEISRTTIGTIESVSVIVPNKKKETTRGWKCQIGFVCGKKNGREDYVDET